MRNVLRKRNRLNLSLIKTFLPAPRLWQAGEDKLFENKGGKYLLTIEFGMTKH
jgi:hypothetical protein